MPTGGLRPKWGAAQAIRAGGPRKHSAQAAEVLAELDEEPPLPEDELVEEDDEDEDEDEELFDSEPLPALAAGALLDDELRLSVR